MSILCSLREIVLAPGGRYIFRHLAMKAIVLWKWRYSPVDGKSYLVVLGQKGRPSRFLEAQETGQQAEPVGTPVVLVVFECCHW